MPQSTKELRKLRQKQALERGEDHTHHKPPAQFGTCAVCKQQIRLSKKNLDLVQHVQSRHPDKTFDDCFLGIEHE